MAEELGDCGCSANFRAGGGETLVTGLRTLAESSADTRSLANNAETGCQLFGSGAVAKILAKVEIRQIG